MPKRSKPLRTPDHLRQQIGDDIAVGFGRNEIARRHGVSPGLVSKIARERGLGFRNTWMVDTAVQARQVDLFKQRADKAEALWQEQLQLIGSRVAADPLKARPARTTRREKKLSYAIYNLDRHHNGTYKAL